MSDLEPVGSERLAREVRGELVLPSNADYDEARRVFNGISTAVPR